MRFPALLLAPLRHLSPPRWLESPDDFFGPVAEFLSGGDDAGAE